MEIRQEFADAGAALTSETVISKGDHIAGIDSLRAIAALIVLFDHLGYVPGNIFQTHQGHIFVLSRLFLNCLFNGPAAVIIFFVVSGFFIHLPQTRKNAELNIPRFYVRRFIRIGIPALLTFFIFVSLKIAKLDNLNHTILWSVICEAIYYFIYPAVLLLGRRFGWGKVVIVAYIIAFAFCLLHLQELRTDNSYVVLGWWTWVVGLPCWTVGCLLAENRKKFGSATSLQIWLIRFAIFSTAFLLRAAKFHVHSAFASNCFSLNLFSLPVALWIGVELASSAELGTSRILEWIGKWSYSIYLMHPAIASLLALGGIAELLNNEPYLLSRCALALVLAYAFYLVIEKPSHRLAIRLSRLVSPHPIVIL